MAWEIPVGSPLASINGQDFTWATISFPVESIGLVRRATGSSVEWVAVAQVIIGDAEKDQMMKDFRGFVNGLVKTINAGLKNLFAPPAVQMPEDVSSLVMWLMKNTDIQTDPDRVPQVTIR